MLIVWEYTLAEHLARLDEMYRQSQQVAGPSDYLGAAGSLEHVKLDETPLGTASEQLREGLTQEA